METRKKWISVGALPALGLSTGSAVAIPAMTSSNGATGGSSVVTWVDDGTAAVDSAISANSAHSPAGASSRADSSTVQPWPAQSNFDQPVHPVELVEHEIARPGDVLWRGRSRLSPARRGRRGSGTCR
jgi:hypothetical protein